MKLFGASMLLVAGAACTDGSARMDGDNGAAAVNGTPAPAASYAPREANGLPGRAAVLEALEKSCSGQTPEIRRVSCKGYDEEPTEFSCKFEHRQEGGNWKNAAMTIAIDGQYGWLDIGGSKCNFTKTN